jgi:hypothetical protein
MKTPAAVHFSGQYSTGVELAVLLIVLARGIAPPAKPLRGKGYDRDVAPVLVPVPVLASGKGSRATNAATVAAHDARWKTALSDPLVRALYVDLYSLTPPELAVLDNLQAGHDAGLLQIFPGHWAKVATGCSHSWGSKSRWKTYSHTLFVSPELGKLLSKLSIIP